MVPNILVVHPSVSAQNVQELIALARAKPGTLVYGSAGNGSSVHLSAELFKSMTKVDMQHIPFAGSAPSMVALLGGQVMLMFDNLPSAIQHVKSGRLRALAVTSEQRVPSLPNVPTIAESGVPGYSASSWFGLLAPAHTPPEIVTRLNVELQHILNTPAVRTQMLEMGAFAHPESPTQFGDFIAAETTRWAQVVRTAGARVD
jgi:tripartite-type tricarboxylate transporter receptor subunit TctC